MDDEPMWAADRVVALTPGSTITIPETANEFAIKEKQKHGWTNSTKELSKHGMNLEPLSLANSFPPTLFDRLLGEIHAFSQHENKSLTDAWLRMKEMLRNFHGHNLSKDAMTIKMDAQYKELQSRAKQPTPDLDNDDIPMSHKEEAKSMQNFRKTHFYNDYRDRDSNRDNWRSSGQNDYNRDSYLSNTDDKSYDLQRQFNDFMKSQTRKQQTQNQTNFCRFLSDESSAILQNKVPPKLGDPGSFLIPCNFNKIFSCNALANLGASINLMPYSLYAKLSLETLKPTKISVRLADRSFQYPVGIAENMLVEVGKFTFPADFVILKMEEDSKIPLILGRPFLHTVDAVIWVKQKQPNLGVRTERMTFNIDSAIKHSYSNDDTCFSIDVITEILEEDFDALFDEGSKILYSLKGTILEEEIFFEFDQFIAMTTGENYDFESDTEEPPFEKIIINTDYKIKTSLEEPPTDLKLKPLPDNLKYVFLEEPSFLPVIISSKLSTQNKSELVFVLKKHKEAFA
ncbi:reverse transcriptase domain-containing protein [Tanacetum coccineum]|uniref:Reverse transcriptase domain-containing protein n=1 Tax=Tanacetum coccineum TaxID=301880 RepID=A0ABQ5EMU4_9ASTR